MNEVLTSGKQKDVYVRPSQLPLLHCHRSPVSPVSPPLLILTTITIITPPLVLSPQSLLPPSTITAAATTTTAIITATTTTNTKLLTPSFPKGKIPIFFSTTPGVCCRVQNFKIVSCS
eukprot:TRINITY_DN13441_c1_g2_i13.p3 TRINITY_DN13441_c1_g2~~TRINITY_DN13441_c1_g2_i13.p3  ORF type:complete len:118 (+),score=24.59 TRINITY_DN13441_c1_g2_i13:427-780(+)